MILPLFLTVALPIAGLVILFSIRAHWIMHQLEVYQLHALYFLWQTKASAQTREEMTKLWPGSYILLEMWRWDWRRYVVHQDRYDEMRHFILDKLTREDIGWDMFKDIPPETPPDEPPTHGDN